MKEAIHYSKAPIIEALIDIQIDRLRPDKLALLKSLKLPEGYREIQMLGEFTSEVRIEQHTPVASATGGPVGFRFQSRDEKYVVQARLNGFTISRLAPYEHWEPFIREARSAWMAYFAAIGHVALTQFSARYINKIHMPPGSDMKEYLRTSPEISPELPQMLSGTFMRLEIPFLEPPALLIHQQFYVPSDEPGQIGMILDNEVRVTTNLESISDADLWDRIGALRELKNKAFVGCLTEKMKEKLT